mmetsp:Transcript_4101/g.9433  ORF Transcript_4101/g.9433 Transcript_4101/m.9433 type:complete len:101 (+) Transcript_4101:301-603(+)
MARSSRAALSPSPKPIGAEKRRVQKQLETTGESDLGRGPDGGEDRPAEAAGAGRHPGLLDPSNDAPATADEDGGAGEATLAAEAAEARGGADILAPRRHV